MPITAFAALSFAVNKILDWARDLVPDQLTAKVLVPISWVVGMLATLAFCTVDAFAKSITFGDFGSLASLGVTAQLIFGFGVGCAAGVINDYKPQAAQPTVNVTAVQPTSIDTSADDTAAEVTPKRTAAKRAPAKRAPANRTS